jgi:hypothetical protein
LQKAESGENNLAIAWQYQKYLVDQKSEGTSIKSGIQNHITNFKIKLGSLKANTVQPFCHSYHLSYHVKEETLSRPEITGYSPVESSTETSYHNLYKKLHTVISDGYKRYFRVFSGYLFSAKFWTRRIFLELVFNLLDLHCGQDR